MSNSTIVFKFCTAAGGAAILRSRSLFITSPLDLNDPFEMRPAWTDAHEKRHLEDQETRNAMMAGKPLIAAMEGGKPQRIGTMPKLAEQPVTPVEHHRGIADMHNEKVFRLLHQRYRILSFSTDIIALDESYADSNEKTTLLWSHYADSFQGVCLAFDSTQFENGLKPGGFRVDYSPSRTGLPPSFYDDYPNLTADKVEFGGVPFEEDSESGLLLMEHNREEKFRDQLIKFLAQKSPAWEYEHEVRMIYELKAIQASSSYTQPRFACEDCRRANKTPEQCENATDRDAIRLPAAAIRAVIFGTDTSKAEVAEILALLDTPDFARVGIYWSSLHSDRYVLQYNRDQRTGGERYSVFIQEQRARQIAGAKGHMRFTKERTQYIAAKKTVNYLQKPQAGEGTP